MDKFTIKCYDCDYTWTQEKDYGGVDWKCPKCKSDSNTFLIDYEPEDKDFYNREITLGVGGALHA